jgi:prepilin-type N-terminal cleavage/methylation domain-containing protein
MTTKQGFSLIELLIVVSIILIIAAIAIPNLLRSKISANEAAATAVLRTLGTAELTYASTYNSGFTDTLTRLGAPAPGAAPNVANGDFVDSVLAGVVAGSTNSFTKSGYTFTYTPAGAFGSIATFTVNAEPNARGSTGQRSFYADQTSTIRANSTSAATSTDQPI